MPKRLFAGQGRFRRAERGARRAKQPGHSSRFPPIALPGLLLLLPLLTAAGRCDNAAIDPFQESDLYYSIFGVLDGGVDSQFVRVTPVRDSIALGPGPIDATVTLEHLASGRKTAWRDSLFSFQTALARTVRLGHNFWSAEPLEPRASYRLTVTRSDGATSTATATLPDTFPDPIIDGNTIKIRGVDRLADVQVVYRVWDLILRQPATHTVSYLRHAIPLDDEWWVIVDRIRDQNEIVFRLGGTEILLRDITVIVAAAGPEWPDFAAIDPETLALPATVSNVERGVGFLGGIVSKTIPWPGFERSDTPP